MEYLFTNCPVTSLHSREQGPRRAVYFTYEVTGADHVSTTVDAVLADWTCISMLYQLVLQFAAQLSASRGTLNKSYFWLIINWLSVCLQKSYHVRHEGINVPNLLYISLAICIPALLSFLFFFSIHACLSHLSELTFGTELLRKKSLLCFIFCFKF